MALRYKAAIFDLDGTLLNTLDDLWASVNEYLGRHGLPARSRMEVRSFLGNGARELIRRSLPVPVTDGELDKAVSEYKKIYERNMSRSTRPYDGIPQLLLALREAGIQTAVVSNKPDHATRSLVESLLPGLLTVAVGDRPDAPRKPDPGTVLGILDRLGVRPQDALYVGDSEVDVRTAKNAGMDSAAVAWGFRDRDLLESEKPIYLVETPAQLAGVLGVDLNAG